MIAPERSFLDNIRNNERAFQTFPGGRNILRGPSRSWTKGRILVTSPGSQCPIEEWTLSSVIEHGRS